MEQEQKRKPGRPKIELDTGLIEQLASIFCTNGEIAEIMGCSIDTLQRNYALYIKRGKANAKSSLRRLQWSKAQDGNVPMLIWLGKQYLSQRDQPQEATDLQPLPWTDSPESETKVDTESEDVNNSDNVEDQTDAVGEN